VVEYTERSNIAKECIPDHDSLDAI